MYEIKYLELLAKEFPTVQAVSTELVNLTAILNLPKGTEHFLSDIHGEYDTFNHFIKNGSGVILDKIQQVFPELSKEDQNRLSFFAYYPKQMLKKYEDIIDNDDLEDFIRLKLLRLINLAKHMSSKYTKSKIGKILPGEFAYIIQELLFESSKNQDKNRYYDSILDAIFKTKREKNFLIELSRFIQRLTIDRLHIVGDIFDRGPSAHLVLNKMEKYHSLDIVFGNHDVLWMGAASGNEVAICNVIRNSTKYNTLDTLEEGYGINMLPLAKFALKYYGDDDCKIFAPKSLNQIDEDEAKMVAKIHKAISILQFKLEYRLAKRKPEFDLDNRLLLDSINYNKGTILYEGIEYPLLDTHFPTVNPEHPYELIEEEISLIKQLKNAFLNNDLLQRHIKFLFHKGQMFSKYNNNLLFHGCIPLNSDGGFSSLMIDGRPCLGKSLLEELDKKIRSAFLKRYEKDNHDKDYFIFLWQGENSPLFGKKEMKTFERYFIKEKDTHFEEMNNYFTLREETQVLKNIYEEFELDWDKSKIINGHVPTDVTVGELPVKADGRIYAIDGGMSKQYSAKISIGGYTLVVDSYKIFLVSHERFPSVDDLIENEEDIISVVQSEDIHEEREYIFNTDKGQRMQDQIDDLYKLLDAYRQGIIKERTKK